MPMQRNNWDISQLVSKYPWLRVDAETIEDYKTTFSKPSSKRCKMYAAESSKRCQSTSEYSWVDPTLSRAKPLKMTKAIPRKLPAVRNRKTNGGVGAEATKPTTKQAPSSSEHEACMRTIDYNRDHHGTLCSSSELQLEAVCRSKVKRRRKKTKKHNILSLSFPRFHKEVDKYVATKDHAVNPLGRRHNTYEDCIQHLHQDQQQLKAEILKQIDDEKAKLPLTFLFERSLDHSYCRERSIATITRVFSRLQNKLLNAALWRWKGFVHDALRAQVEQQALEQAQRWAITFLQKTIVDNRLESLKLALQKWIRASDRMRAVERTKAAIVIQIMYRSKIEKVRAIRLEEAAAAIAQKRVIELRLVEEARKQAIALKEQEELIQSYIKIQTWWRRISTLRRILVRYRRKTAAVVVQTVWRCRLARKELQVRRELREQRKKKEDQCAIKLQCHVRRSLAVNQVTLLQNLKAQQYGSTLVIQRWYRQSKFLKGLQRRFLKQKEKLDRIRRAEEEAAISKKQQLVRNASAIPIQRIVRGFISRQQVHYIREAKLRALAALRVQTWWRQWAAYRLLQMRRIARQAELEAREQQAGRVIRSAVIYAAYIGKLNRRRAHEYKRHCATITIQRCMRGKLVRKVLAHKQLSALVIQSVLRMFLIKRKYIDRSCSHKLDEIVSIVLVGRLQRWFLSILAYRHVRRLRMEKEHEIRMRTRVATFFQSRYRGYLLRKNLQCWMRMNEIIERASMRDYGVNRDAGSATAKVISPRMLSFSLEELRWTEGYLTDMELIVRQEDHAITIIQKCARGRIARIAVRQMKKQSALEIKCATRIQRIQRGFAARAQVAVMREVKRKQEMKAAYIRERRWKEEEAKIREQRKRELLEAELVQFAETELQLKEAKRAADLAKYNAEVAMYRAQELMALADVESRLQDARKYWRKAYDNYGNEYYYNDLTNESSWTLPEESADETEKAK